MRVIYKNSWAYAKWENFSKVIGKAITSCQNAGYEPSDHFAEIIKMVVERWGFCV